jgi:RNA polymerase sigma-70 factor (ECF subfamily)
VDDPRLETDLHLRPVDQSTDEALARAASTGDEEAFKLIFERQRRRVTRLVGRFFNRPERIEDLVQEVFTKVYFALGDYTDRRGATFATWISRIAINACYDELRRARRRPESAIADVGEMEVAWLRTRLDRPPTVNEPESNAIARDLAGKLLSVLSPDDRLVLTLLDAEEASVNDVAQLTGWSVSKVKVRAHRARAALRRVLSQFI